MKDYDDAPEVFQGGTEGARSREKPRKVGRIKRDQKFGRFHSRDRAINRLEPKRPVKMLVKFLLAQIVTLPFCLGAIDTIDNGLLNDPDIECAAETINVNFNTKNPFEGKVYIKGHVDEPGCRVGPDQAGNNSTNMKAFGISVPFARCGVSRKR